VTGGTDLFEIPHTTRATRRLKPDPVPDELVRYRRPTLRARHRITIST